MDRWRIGAFTITRIPEHDRIPGMKQLLPDATPAALAPLTWLSPHFVSTDSRLLASIHAFVVQTPDACILVDTCVGNDKPRSYPGWDRQQGPFLRQLGAAGMAPEDIDFVLCTHMHIDHVGWNTRWQDGRWQPTFPRARYLFGRTEFEYWRAAADAADPADGLDVGQVLADSVQPILDAGLADFVDAPYRVCAGVELVPTPGHTPGHVSVALASEGRQGFITGDLLHHPCQIARPHWCASADVEPERATITRREVLARLADSGTLMLGTHFAPPTAGRVVVDGETWRLDCDS